jgi:predicted nuclease with TOPRIM domain
MSKALKPLIIVVLLLSIAALSLGVILFMQREVLKGRVQKLEQGHATVATKIHFDDFKVTQLAVKDKLGLENMQAPLNKLAAAAENQYTDLVNTKQDLENTKKTLEETKTELASTKATLEQTQAEVARLNDEVQKKDTEIAQANTKIGQLEQDKLTMQTQIDGLTQKVTKLEDDNKVLSDDLKAAKNELLGYLQTPGIGPKGLTGHILVVNKDWNFVVLDIGSDKGLSPNTPMLIHRGDKLIGKVMISSVTRTIAVAELLGDWMQAPPLEGDFVVY